MQTIVECRPLLDRFVRWSSMSLSEMILSTCAIGRGPHPYPNNMNFPSDACRDYIEVVDRAYFMHRASFCFLGFPRPTGGEGLAELECSAIAEALLQETMQRYDNFDRHCKVEHIFQVFAFVAFFFSK